MEAKLEHAKSLLKTCEFREAAKRDINGTKGGPPAALIASAGAPTTLV